MDRKAGKTTEGGFQNRLYRAELGRTTSGNPFVKIIPTNPEGAYAHERHIAATTHEIAAELERKTYEMGEQWLISDHPNDGRIVVELNANNDFDQAEELIREALAELSIPVANPQ
jgi:hypothetical protein